MHVPNDSQDSPPTLPDLLRLTRQFEQAWRQVDAGGSPPELSAHLPPPSDSLRPVAVKELVRVDLEMRWRRNLPATLESYIQRYPELGGAAALPVELIYQEYRVRRQYGDRPSLTLYRERFPAQYQQLLKLVQAKRDPSLTAGSLRPPTPANRSPGPKKTPMPPAGAGKSEPAATRQSSAERKSPASLPAEAPNTATEMESLPVLPYVPPLPAPKNSGASAELETSGQEGGTFAPGPASGEKSGDLLVPSADTAAGADLDEVPIGGYRLLKFLGSGAFGKVWKAEAPGGVEVALKRLDRTLDSHEAQCELRSLEHVKGLRHRYLAQIHAFWVKDGRLRVVMELADGSLADRATACRQQGLAGIPQDELLRYMREAAEALDYLHAKGVHHRDIKPANILLLNGNVKVADFGLARLLHSEQSVVNATFCGTPAYMPPELFESKFSAHSDQWSLAVTYLELRLNRRPFKSRDLPSLMTEIRKGQLNLSPLGQAEKRVLQRALRQNPRERYPSCTAFVEALEAVFRPPPPRPPMSRWLQTVIVVLAFLAAGGLLASFIQWMIRPPPPQAPQVHLTAPSVLPVQSGRKASLPVTIRREHYEGPVRIVADEGLPPGVRIDEVVVPSGEESVVVTVHAAQEAKPRNVRVRLRTADASLMGEAHFDLTILYLPLDYEPVGTETQKDAEGVSYYQQIAVQLNDGKKVEFVLVPRGQMEAGAPDDPKTFYISRNKITRGQFGCLAAAAAEKPSAEWTKYAEDDENMPIRGIRFRDAYLCARWLRGRLPGLEQWDKAAGLWYPTQQRNSHGEEGPYRGKWDDVQRLAIAVNREQPLAVNDDGEKDDISVYGCRGMAGNGREWTRARHLMIEVASVEEIKKQKWGMILRGWSFKQKHPLTFVELEKQRGNDLGHRLAESSLQTAEDIGFRVVLEPNR